jgi:hypothetical protein
MDETITIVSGLPRSGTSLMMRMLGAGGMRLLVDNIRKADEDNPKGYYEFERVKRLKEDSSWLRDARGGAVKMVSALLRDLPSSENYKILFMKRNMIEVLASQKVMLERRGESRNEVSDGEMARLFKKHLAETEKWLEKRENMQVIYISYNDILGEPFQNALAVRRFVGMPLDIDKMVGVVDKSLYRQRRDSKRLQHNG